MLSDVEHSVRHRTWPQFWGKTMPRGNPTSRKSLVSKNPAKSLVKMQAFALDMEELAERGRKPRAGAAIHRPRYGVASHRPRLSDLRPRLHGGPAARRIEGDLDKNDQGVRVFVVGLGSRLWRSAERGRGPLRDSSVPDRTAKFEIHP